MPGIPRETSLRERLPAGANFQQRALDVAILEINTKIERHSPLRACKDQCGPRLNTICEFCHSSESTTGTWCSRPRQNLPIAVQETDSRRAYSSPKFCMVAFQSSTW